MHFIAMFYSFVYVRVSFNGYNLEVSSHKIVTQIHSQVSFAFLLEQNDGDKGNSYQGDEHDAHDDTDGGIVRLRI